LSSVRRFVWLRNTAIIGALLCILFVGESHALAFSLALSTTSTVKAPDVILQKGNVANSTIYTNSTSAAVATPTVNYPTSYIITLGTYTSGSIPSSVNSIDSSYFQVAAGGSGQPKQAITVFTFGTSSTTPSQLNFTIVEQYSMASVTVTIQVFNFTGNSYPTSGQGYATYTSSATPSTDQTQSLTITSNPQFYSSSGQVKIQIMATGSANGGFNQLFNFVRLYYYQQTYDYVLKIVNQQTSTYNVRLNTVGLTQTNIGRLSNFTAWIHGSSSALQTQILSGSLSTPTGTFLSLADSTTVYVAIRVTATSAGVSTISCYLQIYTLGTSTYANYRLTLSIT